MCLNEYASHPIQTLIEKASSKEEIDIILQAICSYKKFIKICVDPKGTYVIRKILQCVNENFRLKINELIINNINILVADTNGVCIVVKYILSCETKCNIDILAFLFIQKIVLFSNNKYSNYAVQALFTKIFNYKDLFALFINGVINNFVALSTNRYGNYIVSVVINYLDNQTRNLLLMSIKQEKLHCSKYGSIVLSKLIKSIESTDYKIKM